MQRVIHLLLDAFMLTARGFCFHSCSRYVGVTALPFTELAGGMIGIYYYLLHHDLLANILVPPL